MSLVTVRYKYFISRRLIKKYFYVTINSSQKDAEVFCVALVGYKVTTIYEINDSSAE